jgi:hypothetical protein
MRSHVTRLVLGAALSLAAIPAGAQTSVNRTVPFELDKWFELGVKEGPITLHRLRLVRQSGGMRSRVMGENEYATGVKVELEYSNVASTDWKAAFRVVWSDDAGDPIDGYTGTADLDERKEYERAGGTVSTLKYGLMHARKLKIGLDVKPE